MIQLLDEFLSVEENFRLGGGGGPATDQEAIDAMRKVCAFQYCILV